MSPYTKGKYREQDNPNASQSRTFTQKSRLLLTVMECNFSNSSAYGVYVVEAIGYIER